MITLVYRVDDNSTYVESYKWLIRHPTIIYDLSEDFTKIPNIGPGLITGHFVLIREGVKIGESVAIGTHSEIGPGVVIGDNVRIHSGCFIPELTAIEDDVWIGPHVVITNDNEPGLKDNERTMEKKGVVIEHGARIGANVTVLPGVVIGRYSFIGAGSVVTKDVEAGDIVYGNPARSKWDIWTGKW